MYGAKPRSGLFGQITGEWMPIGTSKTRGMAAAAVLAVTVGTGAVNTPQASRDGAVDQAQRAVRTQIAAAEGNVAVRFADNARAESWTNSTRRVRGSGTAVRDRDGKSRPFAYDAVVDTRTRQVSSVHHHWDGDWRTEEIHRVTRIAPMALPARSNEVVSSPAGPGDKDHDRHES
jgi:hypothetical protein